MPAGARMTRSTAAERRGARGLQVALQPDRLLPLLAAALVSLLGLGLVYVARTAGLSAAKTGRERPAVVDLNDVRRAADIEPALARILPHAGDRRFAAEAIVAELPAGGDGDPLPNVGLLATLRVGAGSIAARGDLEQYAARAAPLLASQDASASLPLLTLEQYQEIKPAFVVRDLSSYRRAFLLYVLVFFAAFLVAHFGLHAAGRAGEPLLLPTLQLLTGLGLMALVSLRDPLRDSLLFSRFAQGVGLGALAMIAASFPVYERSVLRRLAYIPLLAALALSAALVLFGTGPGDSDAKVNLFGAQPIELIRLLIVLFLAGYFASRWAFLRELDERPLGRSWLLQRLRLPRLDHALPVAAGVALGLLFFFLQKDLGPALILLCLFLALYAVSRRHVALGLAGLLLIVAAFSVSFAVGHPRTVSLRTAMWISPWENGLTRGDQLAHALWAFAAGGLSGTGLGLGSPAFVPAAHTDLVLAVVGEELGFVGTAAALALFALLIGLGLRIARRAPADYTTFLALGITLSLALQVLLIVAGILGLAPLAGVVTPFMSYGRSALVMHFAGLGILWSISASSPGVARQRSAQVADGAFHAPVRWVTAILGALAVAVIAKAGWVQVVRGDQVLASASLALQADGEHRYQHNPRLRQVAASIPRGSIRDRNGILLATSRWEELEQHRADFELLGVDIDEACSPDDARHYPFGGITYHLLGDAVSRRDWGASNTSFVERDSDSVLRGFDDQARAVVVADPASSEPRRVVRRDLGELVPLWRHRHQPNHKSVRAVLDRERDMTLTLDIRLQRRAAQALHEELAARGLERGAVVVIVPETGELLASVSHPWPEAQRGAVGKTEGDAAAALLDRARFGLYPPGSTFKLVTAVAALTENPALAQARFPCRSLPGGRVGAVVGGRPVRDDREDRPHGNLSMEEGTIVSCNAYYAQLGMKVGWTALARTAALFEIPIGEPQNDAERRAHLVEASYGQGHVLASPFKMARVAATIAAAGKMAEGHWVQSPANDNNAPPHGIMEEAAAATLRRYMRGVVERGTARALAGQQPAIAGKTGTAQVSNKPSHAWFIGYAPHGRAEKRIAFAVLLEHGGYGGAGATEVAGKVVRAARELRLIE